METPSPRERRHERTRQAILDAARDILVRQGVDALSMRAIAEQIDYSPAGLYEYFGSKEEIVGAVCMAGHRRLRQFMLRADPNVPPAEYLVEIGLAYIDFALQNRDYFLLMFSSAPPPHWRATSIEEYAAEASGESSSFPTLLNAIERGIEAGVFKVLPGFGKLELAYAAWSLVHGIAMLRITQLTHFPADFSAIDRIALQRFGRGLAAG